MKPTNYHNPEAEFKPESIADMIHGRPFLWWLDIKYFDLVLIEYTDATEEVATGRCMYSAITLEAADSYVKYNAADIRELMINPKYYNIYLVAEDDLARSYRESQELWNEKAALFKPWDKMDHNERVEYNHAAKSYYNPLLMEIYKAYNLDPIFEMLDQSTELYS